MNGFGFEASCAEPELAAYVMPYCFGDVSDDDRQAFELHLMECDVCWREVDRLSACVRVLRTDSTLKQAVVTPELFGLLGMSGWLDAAFGGHAAFAIISGTLYGLLFAASVWTELGYSYDRFGMLAWTLTPLVFLVMSGALALGLWLDHRRVIDSKGSGLLWSGIIVVSAAILMVAAMFVVLPSDPTIQAAFQTRSASAGFQKNVTYYFLPLLLFILPTFHMILALQRELRLGRHEGVFKLLSGDRTAIVPRGAWFVKPWVLGLGLVVAAVIGVTGTNNMLDGLQPGPYANLFTAALHTRVGLWFAIAVVSMAWYQRSLNELKREALAAVRLIAQRSQP